jgi:phosphopantetheinyl transferase (holo-ACP synthase)
MEAENEMQNAKLMQTTLAQTLLHQEAVDWALNPNLPVTLGWIGFTREFVRNAPKAERRFRRFGLTHLAARAAVYQLFRSQSFPNTHPPHDLHWQNDARGKPSIAFQGELEAWAIEHGFTDEYLQISNTNDGDANIVLAAYGEEFAGIGVDVVHLPRLRQAGKGMDYLRRFARQFMSETEWEAFEAGSEHDDEEGLRVRVAAHFSLMEAASKAVGTGLKMGIGMGVNYGLPKAELGALRLRYAVELYFGSAAKARLSEIGATQWEGFWGADDEYLVSGVVLRR